MADDKKQVGGASAGQAFADRGGSGGAADRNQPVTTGDTGGTASGDPLAYRTKGDNATKRANHIERVIIDHFYNGSTDRFDTDAGLEREA